jgi:hypothetical protein
MVAARGVCSNVKGGYAASRETPTLEGTTSVPQKKSHTMLKPQTHVANFILRTNRKTNARLNPKIKRVNG